MWKIIVDLHFHNTVQVQIEDVMRHTCSAAISSHEYLAATVSNPWMFRATCLETHRRAESRLKSLRKVEPISTFRIGFCILSRNVFSGSVYITFSNVSYNSSHIIISVVRQVARNITQCNRALRVGLLLEWILKNMVRHLVTHKHPQAHK